MLLNFTKRNKILTYVTEPYPIYQNFTKRNKIYLR